MAGRKIKDERDASQCLQAALQSGVSRKQWARDHGVDARSLNAWHMNLTRRTPRTAPGLRLVELVPGRSNERSPLVLRCGAWEVEVADDFDEDLLVRVMDLVALC